MKLEIIADSIEAAIIAQENGADRIELCEDLSEGGITPSYALIERAHAVLDIELYVMIRPRGGDFLYTKEEFNIMKRNIEICREIGVDGVVLGILLEDGKIDIKRTKTLVEIARPMGVTFHRAFDHAQDHCKSLEAVIETGADRILTSGLHPSAHEGIDVLKELGSMADNRIIIMAGSGITSANIEDLIRNCSLNEYHSSAKIRVESKMKFRNNTLNMGRGGEDDFSFFTVNGQEVKDLREKIKKY